MILIIIIRKAKIQELLLRSEYSENMKVKIIGMFDLPTVKKLMKKKGQEIEYR
jgi:hypothetical protein